ncbi:MAG: hypothetical protein U0528_04435 [Anaerolineae bacterium]
MVFSSGGEEYPNILFIYNQRDSVYRRFITAHEVGHQWFYGIAGNRYAQQCLPDESMTQYAGYLFLQIHAVWRRKLGRNLLGIDPDVVQPPANCSSAEHADDGLPRLQRFHEQHLRWWCGVLCVN